MSREKIFANGLYALNGLGSKRLKRLYEATGSAEGILKHSKNELLELAGNSRPASLFHLQEEYQNNPEDVFKRMEKFCMEQEEKGIYFTFIGDEDYPHRLLKISDPPFGLYYKGHLPKQETPIVSVIGARECSEYGRKCAKMFGETLAEYGVAVVSGMARGIDGISQSAALEAGGESYGILGCGVDICYPKENRNLYERLTEHGGVISEYPPGTEAKSTLFPARNRIISGMCDILLVVEARKKSGTYITVCQALEQGREIFAVPGRITDGLSDGCNRLIADGAGMAADPMMVLDALCGINGASSRVAEKTEEKDSSILIDVGDHCIQDNVLKGLDSRIGVRSALLRILEGTPISMEEILERLEKLGIEISYADLMCELTDLCIDGRAEGIGNYYRKV